MTIETMAAADRHSGSAACKLCSQCGCPDVCVLTFSLGSSLASPCCLGMNAGCLLQEADVILISGDSAPPVCRLIALDKYKYELAKVERETKRKQREAR